MGRCAIAPMPRKAVRRIVLIEFVHHGVTAHLGQNRSRHDGGFQSVPAHQCAGRTGHRRRMEPIDQNLLWQTGQGQHRPPHCQQAGLQNIQRFNFLHRGNSHGVTLRVRQNFVKKAVTSARASSAPDTLTAGGQDRQKPLTFAQGLAVYALRA